MTQLSEIVPLHELQTAIADGYVRLREHVMDPHLVILNYTEKAQYENVWNAATTRCRGLIVRLNSFDGDGRVVARGFDKFFNYGQEGAARIDLDSEPVIVTDKLDGSLGIMYLAPDGQVAIATRGSFASEQAIHATALLRSKYAEHLEHFALLSDVGWTFLFEIVYPENRIVVDYGQQDDLVYLGAVMNDTGSAVSSNTPAWVPMPRAAVLEAETLADALALPPRPNAEGVVVAARLGGLNRRVKIKQEDYIRLHRLVTGLNERVVWEHLRDHDGTYEDLLAAVPDEFHGWVREKADALRARWFGIANEAFRTHSAILDGLPGGYTRKDFALAAASFPELRQYLFLIEDDKYIGPAIWKKLKPQGVTASLLNRTEDNA